MKLKDIAAEPKLIPVVLDDEDTLKEYNEPLEFYTWDRQPMTTFIKLAESNSTQFANMVEVMRDLILDEQGKPVMTGNQVLPSKILMRAMTKLTEILGK